MHSMHVFYIYFNPCGEIFFDTPAGKVTSKMVSWATGSSKIYRYLCKRMKKDCSFRWTCPNVQKMSAFKNNVLYQTLQIFLFSRFKKINDSSPRSLISIKLISGSDTDIS